MRFVCFALLLVACTRPLDLPEEKTSPTNTTTCEGTECPARCTTHTTNAECVADSSCVPLFEDPGTCDCNLPGCCLAFAKCLTGPPLCGDMPDCGFAPIECGPEYTPIVFEGCVAGCTPNLYCATGT